MQNSTNEDLSFGGRKTNNNDTHLDWPSSTANLIGSLPHTQLPILPVYDTRLDWPRRPANLIGYLPQTQLPLSHNLHFKSVESHSPPCNTNISSYWKHVVANASHITLHVLHLTTKPYASLNRETTRTNAC